MYLQLQLHERKLLSIGNMSVANCHVNRRDNIHQDSLAQWQFRLYKQCSLSDNLLGYTQLLNPTTCSLAEMSLVYWLQGRYPQPTTRDSLKRDKTYASRVQSQPMVMLQCTG